MSGCSRSVIDYSAGIMIEILYLIIFGTFLTRLLGGAMIVAAIIISSVEVLEKDNIHR